MVLLGQSKNMARNTETVVSPQQRVQTIPHAHKANTYTCGLVKFGKCSAMLSRHW